MKIILSILVSILCTAGMAPAAVVTFTGGTAYGDPANGGLYFFDPVLGSTTLSSGVTDGTKTYRAVDYYVENGFKFDYVGGIGGSIGNYYEIGRAHV